jgi:creatinine amidohydrolase/Fe(II)-dependent formamide hydrolase-like protein
MVRGVELEALSATALTGLIQGGVTTVVVPFGSVEHHGGHLPLGADALVADALGREVAGRLDAVLAPTVRVGDTSAHMKLADTMSVSAETLTAVAFELSLSLPGTGFTFIALMSAHGGNRAALDAAVLRPRKAFSRARHRVISGPRPARTPASGSPRSAGGASGAREPRRRVRGAALRD